MSNRNLLTIVIVLLVGIIALLVFKEPAQPDIGDTAEHVSETFREVVAELDHNG